MARRKVKFSAPLTVFLCILALLLGLLLGVLGAAAYDALNFKSDEVPPALVTGEFQVHFPELGNKYTGDCTYIKAGDVDILIDAGSRASSVAAIAEYIDRYVTDGKLEYVIVTHAHQDHYAGFAVTEGSIFDLYECEVIIDFAKTNQEKTGTNMYSRYLAERDAEVAAGATHYTAAECIESGNAVFTLGNGATMTVLDSYYYYNEAESENDYSVCTLFTYGDYRYLFTGDLEKEGEEHLVLMNELPEVTLYKAGHHGSKTSSSEALLEVIKPQTVCVCCCCGSPEYTKTDANQFPTQAFIDRIALYTDKVYVTTMCVDYEAGKFTSMNGNITVVSDKNGVGVICSNDNRVLKEWEWFSTNRVCPEEWK